MKPPMNQSIVLFVPGGEKDKFGKPILIEYDVIARVELTTKVVRAADGTEKRATLEVDFKAEIPVGYGSKVKFEDDFGNVIEGTALSIDEAKSLSGKKTYFRTVFFG